MLIQLCAHYVVCTAVHELASLKHDSYFSGAEAIITTFLKKNKWLLNMHTS